MSIDIQQFHAKIVLISCISQRIKNRVFMKKLLLPILLFKTAIAYSMSDDQKVAIALGAQAVASCLVSKAYGPFETGPGSQVDNLRLGLLQLTVFGASALATQCSLETNNPIYRLGIFPLQGALLTYYLLMHPSKPEKNNNNPQTCRKKPKNRREIS